MKAPASTTILLSIFNAELTLDRCFHSLQDQTYQRFNIVCVDDASEDSSYAIIKKWGVIFGGRFKLIRNKTNLGLTKSLNVGLAQCHTRFTARIDSDDWWEKTKLAKQIAYLNSHLECGLVGSNYINFSKSNAVNKLLPQTDKQIKKQIIVKNPFASSCVIFNTALVKDLGGYNPNIRYGQDYDLWLRCYHRTSYRNLPEFLCYRGVGSGVSVTHQREQMFQCVKTQIKYIHLYRLSPLNLVWTIEPLLVGLLSPLIKLFRTI